ncbi:MAG TPA: M20 family metallo-hydrolase [Vicinamibacterales bacterium]|nr:M20 family metallo-hydrolase [Vicinamibacterales bacterium]
MNASADVQRLLTELDTLASFSESSSPAVTRIVFGDMDLRARAYLKTLFAAASLVVREDPVGNTFARWVGRNPSLPAVATGSHCDAIPNAGRYDGTVGVIGGLEAIRALQRSGFVPRRSIDLVMFTSEEPTRFGIGCLGSRLLSGDLDTSAGEMLTSGGETLNTVRTSAGFAGSLGDVRLSAGAYAAFVELHIEQGPLLERDGLDIGVVTAIAAPASLRIVVEGVGGHAGAVLMPDRRDALTAAAEIALAIETCARGTGAIDTVATTGVCEVFPGAINSIPSRARLEVDVRDIDLARRDSVLEGIEHACEDVRARRGVAIRIEPINSDPPARCAQEIVDAIAAACDRRQLRHRQMISRAYHDSLFMSRITPMGMIFIPCRGGISHRPDEYAAPEAIGRGTEVLADTLAALAG